MLRMVAAALVIFLSAASAAQDAPPSPAPSSSASSPPLLMLRQNEASHPERVLLAFHKTAGVEPDYVSWASKSPFLKDAAPGDRDTIISREQNRLRRAYTEFNPDTPLVVHTKVLLDDYSTLQETLNLSEFNAQTYFSYSLYGENVAIVPRGIADFGTIAISKTQMEEILKKAGGAQIRVELLLKPVVGDARTPLDMHGTSYWLLLAQIGEIRFWSANKAEPELLWMNRADWFKPQEDKALMDLKSGTGGM